MPKPDRRTTLGGRQNRTARFAITGHGPKERDLGRKDETKLDIFSVGSYLAIRHRRTGPDGDVEGFAESSAGHHTRRSQRDLADWRSWAKAWRVGPPEGWSFGSGVSALVVGRAVVGGEDLAEDFGSLAGRNLAESHPALGSKSSVPGFRHCHASVKSPKLTLSFSRVGLPKAVTDIVPFPPIRRAAPDRSGATACAVAEEPSQTTDGPEPPPRVVDGLRLEPPARPISGSTESPPGEVLLAIEDLHKRFGKVQALRGVSFELVRGQRLAFLGPNGAGKTTLIRCLAQRCRPDRGSAAARRPPAAPRPP